ncbi:NAD-dependent epimerase/dehydratase family protein [bacterium]|nr:NAD-dependent epimerase/dehydratase family protein [candidate division CSSED10-310 bacterium]
MRIVVTGGAGFIGSHVAEAYIRAGHDVVIIDNLSAGKRCHLPGDARFCHLSIQDADIERVFNDFKPQIVNHHAAHINLRRSVADPVYDAHNNIIGTLNILRCAQINGTEKIIFASTGGAIYGEPGSIPVPESAPALPLSPYGVSKLSVEHYLRLWKSIHGMDFTIFRYPNVYGPRQDPKGEAGVVAIFTLNMLSGHHPVIFGNGSKTRDYIFIEDLVRANVLALTAGGGETLNLGWGLEISDREVFDTISKALDYREEPEYARVRPGEVNRIALDASRAKQVLGWEPCVAFTEGIGRTVRYYCEVDEENSKK